MASSARAVNTMLQWTRRSFCAALAALPFAVTVKPAPAQEDAFWSDGTDWR